MAQHFANDHKVLIMRAKTQHGLPREVRFWAERGLIHCEDSFDNSYDSMSVRSFLQRVKAMNDMLARSASRSDAGFDVPLREEIQRNIEKATEIASQAQVQGMPQDASARRALVRGRPKTFYIGSSDKAIL
jgi:hypothetical protein